MTQLPSFRTSEFEGTIANGLYVQEDHFRIVNADALASDKQPYLATYGLAICKAVSFYDQTRRAGLLAHIGYTRDLNAALSRITDTFAGPMEEVDIRIIKTRQDADIHHWPSMDRLYEYFDALGPKSLAVDPNEEQQNYRNVALDLHTGEISDVYDNGYWYIGNDPEWFLEQLPLED